MSGVSSFALQPASDQDDPARVAAGEAELARREMALASLRHELHELQTRYLRDLGDYYAQLSALEAAVLEAEVAAGLRSPIDSSDGSDTETWGAAEASAAACSNRSAPSDDLKRVFRDLAKTIHPDLALDEPARCRRHSLMAEANRAYAERDADRLRLIMRAWEHDDADAVDEQNSEPRRRLAEIDGRLARIDAESADLRGSAIWRLREKIDDARRQGWDLFAEMILQVRREIARATARLAAARTSRPRPSVSSSTYAGPSTNRRRQARV